MQRAETHIQWRYEGDEWQNLVAIADIEGPAGQNGTDGANGKTPEFRVSENILQWRYTGGEIWLNLYDLTALKGADGRDGADGKDGTNGINGQDGRDGADGNTPFIGENGNWWIGEINTGVKAAGIDGTDGVNGEKGDKGDPGEKGDKGEKGDPGQNGSCPGYFYAEANSPSAVLNNSRVNITVYEKINKGGLISSYRNNITLKKGHIYSVSISGSLEVGSNESNNSGNYSIQMTDGYDDNLCRELTRIKRDGAKIPYTNVNRFTDNITKTKPKVKGNFIMKKFIILALAAVFVLSFTACAKQNGTTAPSVPPKGQPQNALEILEKVWSKYSTDDKFPATGGSEKHMKDNMPGKFDVSDAEALDFELGFPKAQASEIDDAASLMHKFNTSL